VIYLVVDEFVFNRKQDLLREIV